MMVWFTVPVCKPVVCKPGSLQDTTGSRSQGVWVNVYSLANPQLLSSRITLEDIRSKAHACLTMQKNPRDYLMLNIQVVQILSSSLKLKQEIPWTHVVSKTNCRFSIYIKCTVCGQEKYEPEALGVGSDAVELCSLSVLGGSMQRPHLNDSLCSSKEPFIDSQPSLLYCGAESFSFRISVLSVERGQCREGSDEIWGVCPNVQDLWAIGGPYLRGKGLGRWRDRKKFDQYERGMQHPELTNRTAHHKCSLRTGRSILHEKLRLNHVIASFGVPISVLSPRSVSPSTSVISITICDLLSLLSQRYEDPQYHA